MASRTESKSISQLRPISSLWVLGARLTWAGLGPMTWLLITVGIVLTGTGWLTGLDAFYWIAVGLMLLGRWVDHRSGASTTLTGEPATDEHFRRYATGLPLIAVAVWIVANLLGNHAFN